MIQQIKKIRIETLIFFITFIYTSNFSKLFYNSFYSPDFERYVVYIDFFTNRGGNPELDQGVLYFYIVSLFINTSKYLINPNNQELIYSLAIQNANLFFYIIGLIGLYKLLKIYKYSKNDILLLFSFLNILPILFAVRLTMKPEILAFSLLPWVIYYSKQYLNEKEFLYLYFTIPMLSILFTSKGSILGLTIIFLLLFFGKEILNIFKNHTVKGLAVLLILIAFLIPIYMENSKITNSGVLNFEPYLEYMNNAPLNIIYNFDLNDFINNPIRNSQAGSFIGVTLLDTFGDYYQLYWEYEYSLTNTSRKEVLKSGPFYIDLNLKEIYLPINIRYLNLEYYRIYISVLLTLIFYLFLLKDVISKKYNKELKVYLILPFIGMALLLFQVITGIPAQNWDPSKGDSLKPFYYSFLIIISFSFLFIENLKKIKFKNKIFLIISSFLVFMFLMGFPKANNSSFDNQLIFNNQHLFTCEMNSLIFKVTLFETDNITCKKNYEIFCDESLFTRGEIKMIGNEKVKNVNSVKICEELFKENYQYESTSIKLINTPIINLLYFLLSLLLMSYSMMRTFLRKNKVKYLF